jgi:hypothetical protein
MPGQFLLGAAFAVLIAMVLCETFPGRRAVPAVMTMEGQSPAVLYRDTAPVPCREGLYPLRDGGGAALAC